jgi:hypothetical protein
MRIQAFLTATAVNLKRLAAAFLALLLHFLAASRQGKLFSPFSALARCLQRRLTASLLDLCLAKAVHPVHDEVHNFIAHLYLIV